MNAQTKIETGTAVATLANIEDLCAGRDRAIAHWLDAYDDFHRHTKAAAMASIGFANLSPGNSAYNNETPSEELCKAFLRGPDKPHETYVDKKRVQTPARDYFEQLATVQIDRSCWEALLDLTGGRDLMDRQAKEEWRNSLRDPAPFTVENCSATFTNLWGKRRELFLRGIANSFSRLDRRFRSHNGFRIGARIIFDRALDTSYRQAHWNHYERRESFEDVERVLYELDEVPLPERGQTMASQISGRSTCNFPEVIHGPYFRARLFKNGNIHVWFENDELLTKVNKLLAEYYGETIGDGTYDEEAAEEPSFHITPAKKFGAFNTSPEVAKEVARYADIHHGQTVLEPNAGTGELARAARDRGGLVECVEIQPGLAHELSKVHGFKARCADFLTLSPLDLGQFDVVLMNPPFDQGRDCDHVRKAWEFVKPGGKLVAIMSARAEFGTNARHKALHKIVDEADSAYGFVKWHDLPPGSFAHAGTMVNTVVLTLKKKRS